MQLVQLLPVWLASINAICATELRCKDDLYNDTASRLHSWMLIVMGIMVNGRPVWYLDTIRPIPWGSTLPLAPAFETLCLCSPCCGAFVSTAPVMPKVSGRVGAKRHSHAVLDVGFPTNMCNAYRHCHRDCWQGAARGLL